MRASRGLALVAGTSAICLAGLLVASPAYGATLPDGQRITISEQDRPEVGPIANTYYELSPVDATATQVGSSGAARVTAMDVNDDGHGYGVGPANSQQLGAPPVLYTVDANTGTTSGGVDIVPVDEEIDITECPGIDLQPDGSIVLACIYAPDGIVNSYLGTVTPDGAFTVHFDSQEAEDFAIQWTALAQDPLTGVLYAFAIGDGSAFWPVDRSTADWTLGDINLASYYIAGADFDRDGKLWILTQGDGRPFLGVAATATSEIEIIDQIFAGDDPLDDAEAITVWGKPALPATGPAEILPIGIGTALLFLAGAAFIATSRIQRRAA